MTKLKDHTDVDGIGTVASPGESADGSSRTFPEFPEFTKGQKTYTAAVAFIAWSLAVYDIVSFGNMLPAIQDEFGWSTTTASYVATLVSVGSLAVAFVVGPIVDFLGRRLALFVTTAGAALSSGLAGLAIGPISLVLYRSLSGFGQSEQAVNACYLNEVFHAKRRGFFMALVQAGWPVGVMISALMGLSFEGMIGWRGVFVIGSFPLVIILILRIWLKESPFFLKVQYVRKLRAAGDAAGAETAAQHYGLDMKNDRKNTYAALFTPALRKHTIAIGVVFFLKAVADSQLANLATTVLVKGKGINLNTALWTVFAANILAFIAFMVFGWLGDRIGRRETGIACQVLAAAPAAYLLFVADSVVAVMISYSLMLFFTQGTAAVLYAYVGESYPTRVRGTGVAYVAITGPIGFIVGPLMYAMLQSAGFNPAQAALSAVSACVLSALVLLAAKRIPPGQDLIGAAH
ncbi:MFS transporter [Streptomyces sp. NPDC056817]|uniref:MFS transporter n=1 Tax=Streptomyces sp. NPDC056817 TaxID=3345950 RepID=UPI00369655FD